MRTIKAYRFQSSSTMNAIMYKPLDSYNAGTFTIERGTARLKSVKLFGNAMLRDSNNADWATNVALAVSIQNSNANLWANYNGGFTMDAVNRAESGLEKELTPGTYTVYLTASPIVFRHPNFVDAAPVSWTHTTVGVTCTVELEEIEPEILQRRK